MVRNISESGARLAFGDTAYVPYEFDVRITRSDQIKRVRMIWRQDDAIGVIFIASPTPAEVVPFSLAKRLKDAEIERDRLKQKVDELLSTF